MLKRRSDIMQEVQESLSRWEAELQPSSPATHLHLTPLHEMRGYVVQVKNRKTKVRAIWSMLLLARGRRGTGELGFDGLYKCK